MTLQYGVDNVSVIHAVLQRLRPVMMSVLFAVAVRRYQHWNAGIGLLPIVGEIHEFCGQFGPSGVNSHSSWRE